MTNTTHKPVNAAAIVVGASARACAQSLIQAGITPNCVDLFADRDLARVARVLQCPMHDYPAGLARFVVDGLGDVDPAAKVVTTGAMENHLAVLKEIEKSRRLFTGPVSALAAVRKTRFLFDVCNRVDSPLIVGLQEFAAAGDLAFDTTEILPAMRLIPGRWAFKPERSSSGHGIVVFDPKSGLPAAVAGRSGRFQSWVDSAGSLPVSAQFFMPADGEPAVEAGGSRRCRLLGCTLQIIGDAHFGARYETQYVGNISTGQFWPDAGDGAYLHTLEKFGQAICSATGLSGVFGVDLILKPDGILHPIEINPRYTAGMEVVEKATGTSVFSFAFAPGQLRSGSKSNRAYGKAIVYAKADCTVPDLWQHFDQAQIADVPQINEPVPAGRPVCTVLFDAQNAEECLAGLRSLGSRVYTLCKP